jgi:hypothetical protein
LLFYKYSIASILDTMYVTQVELAGLALENLLLPWDELVEPLQVKQARLRTSQLHLCNRLESFGPYYAGDFDLISKKCHCRTC